MNEDENIKRILGNNIQRLRKKRGYTQLTFSELIGLSKNYLSDIECGKSYVRIDKLINIINTLQCSADDIFMDLIEYSNKIKISRLSELFEKISKEDQESAIQLLDIYITKSNK